jgi:hypothetical protein
VRSGPLLGANAEAVFMNLRVFESAILATGIGLVSSAIPMQGANAVSLEVKVRKNLSASVLRIRVQESDDGSNWNAGSILFDFFTGDMGFATLGYQDQSVPPSGINRAIGPRFVRVACSIIHGDGPAVLTIDAMTESL